VKGCNFTISASYLRLRLDLTRFERFERFVPRRRRLAPPCAGGGVFAGGIFAGGVFGGGIFAGGVFGGAFAGRAFTAGGAFAAGGGGGEFAALLPKPKRLVTEFNKLLELLVISTLRQ
jgi:hypothetical protein